MKIQGFFSEISAANNAIKELENSGFQNAFVDINDHYMGDRNVSRNVAGTSTSTSLSDLVLHSSSGNADEGSSPLAAADPMVSGMGTFDDIININYVVSVDANENDAEKAKDILSSAGAELDNPNVSGSKAIANAEVHLDKAISSLKDNL